MKYVVFYTIEKSSVLYVPVVEEDDGGIVLLVSDGPAHRLVDRLHAQVLVVTLT